MQDVCPSASAIWVSLHTHSSSGSDILQLNEQEWSTIIATFSTHANADLLMLVSHCGEYMANGLTNAVRHEFVMIANDRQTFVAVRKHSRSFLWCFECYAGLTSGECMANGLTNAIRHQFAMIAK